MNKEKELIKSINGVFSSNCNRINNVFESDAEIIKLSNEKILLNIDDFSEEDHLPANDPYSLGWNVAIGGISDILASGGNPLFYGHSICLGAGWDEAYIKKFCMGVNEVLKKTGAGFIGGDISNSQKWHYTSVVIGKPISKPLSRRGTEDGDSIYITGKIGCGNFLAGLNIYKEKINFSSILSIINFKFNIRLKESRIIQKYANCCIDTSDGVFNALNTICDINNKGFELNYLPYIKSGTILTKVLNLPEILLFLGECGEYELLFTVNNKNEQHLLDELKSENTVVYRIGSITNIKRKILYEDNLILDLSNFEIGARDYNNSKDYLNAIIQWINERK